MKADFDDPIYNGGVEAIYYLDSLGKHWVRDRRLFDYGEWPKSRPVPWHTMQWFLFPELRRRS